MTKYRAKVDIPPNVKAGDEVTLKDKILPEYEKLLEPIGEAEDEGTGTDDGDKDIITNPDRNELKKRAEELGLNFASNIPTDRLIELIAEAENAGGSDEDEENGAGETDEENEE